MNVNFGIIGFGFMGHIHEQNLSKLDGAEVIAICDIEEERMNDAIIPNVKKYTSVDELLKCEEINTVIISVTNTEHKEVVIKAAKAKKNIICEKPAAMNLEEYDEMVAAAKENGVIFTVHQQRRFDGDFKTAQLVYDNKSLGDIYTIKSQLYGFNGNMHDWHVYKELGGGMLYDWGVHLIDQVLCMVDSKIKTVYAEMRNVINTEVDDYFKIILKFENSICAEIELGTYYLADKFKWFERHWFMGGNKGSMYSDGFEPVGKITRTKSLLTNVPGKVTMTASGPTRSFGPPREGLIITEDLQTIDTDHMLFFKNYLNVINGKEEIAVKPEEVRRVLALMDAIRKSAETNETVLFE